MESRIRSLCTSGIMFFVCLLSFAQDKLSSYKNTILNKQYNISISIQRDSIFTLWVDAQSLDKVYKQTGLLIEQKDYHTFIDALKQAKVKYEEWVKTAKENNVTSVSKQMDVHSSVAGYFYYVSRWQSDFYVKLNFEFKVIEFDKKLSYLLIIKSEELTAYKNEYIKMDGLSLVFTSGKEIDDFLNAISMTKINAYIKQPKKEELFK